MIISNLNNSSRIESLHPLYKRLFDYVKNNDLLSAPLGRIEIDGDNLFINNVNPDGAKWGEQPLEMHREYIDVHILLEGSERMGWKSTEKISNYTQLYSMEGDCALSDDAYDTTIEMQPNDFIIVYPEDAHAPAIGDGKIRKLIAKVRL